MSKPPQEIHCLKWEFCVQLARRLSGSQPLHKTRPAHTSEKFWYSKHCWLEVKMYEANEAVDVQYFTMTRHG